MLVTRARARTIELTMEDTQSPLVLVVDDDGRSRELLRIILRHAGYRVLVATDAQAAVALLDVERPEIALVDFMMPGMTGLDFCRWIRAHPDMGDLKFVLLTGMDDDETRRESVLAGVDHVVIKPFERANLLGRLERLRLPR
jgi:two-component system phosphate regulon response regulator PhoB